MMIMVKTWPRNNLLRTLTNNRHTLIENKNGIYFILTTTIQLTLMAVVILMYLASSGEAAI